MIEYRVVYDKKLVCNCPECPSKNVHRTKDHEYGTTTDVEAADNFVNRAWSLGSDREAIEDVRIEQREIGEWKEVHQWELPKAR